MAALSENRLVEKMVATSVCFVVLLMVDDMAELKVF